MQLKSHKFDTIQDSQVNVTNELKTILQEKCLKAMPDLKTRAKRCILLDGDYFK